MESSTVMSKESEVPEFPWILCPFCSAAWTEDNIRIFEIDSADQCQSGRLEPATYSISIFCHSCKREMYRKEGVYEGDDPQFNWHGEGLPK